LCERRQLADRQLNDLVASTTRRATETHASPSICSLARSTSRAQITACATPPSLSIVGVVGLKFIP